jgi:hypothetical protein
MNTFFQLYILFSACFFTPLFSRDIGNMQQCVRIGHGNVAALHDQKLQNCGVKIIGVLETDPAKKAKIKEGGFFFCATYEEAKQLSPDFWDVCVPSDQHVAVIKNIIQIDPQASILVEKPLCLYHQLPELTDVLKNFHGKLVVNENYLSSHITQRVKEIAFHELKLSLTQIVVEMDKNRVEDFKKGRYIDNEGALKYEGPHMLTILQNLGEEFCPQGEINILYEDVEIPKRLHNQGTADVSYTANSVLVNLFSSMKGDIKHAYAPFIFSQIPEGDATRYRVVAIEGLNPQGECVTVAGFYEPLQGYPRSIGMVVVLKNGHLESALELIEDDTMGKHIERSVNYFRGQGENPCSLEKGIEIVKMLNQLLPK